MVKVASTIRGSPRSCATLAISPTSTKSSTGLPMVSTNRARVFSVMALEKFFGSSWFTNFTLIPRVGRMASNMV